MTGSGPQIPALEAERAPLFARPYLENGGGPVAALLAHVPELLEATLPFVATVLGPSHLGDRLKHIVVLRTSLANGCAYCTRMYRGGANDAGFTASQGVALCEPLPDASDFSTRERAAIAFADAFCNAPATSVEPLKACFRDDEIVALVTLAGATTFLNRFATALHIA